MLLALKSGKYILVNGIEDTDTRNESFSDAQCDLQELANVVTTSFECIEQAGIDVDKMNIVKISPDYEISADRGSIEFKDFKSKIIQGATYAEYKDKRDSVYQKRWHRAGCVLLEYKGVYYICGQDEDSYFISKLAKKRTTILSAFKSLKPSRVIKWEKENKIQAKRQGEWFFIPCPDMVADNMSEEALPHENGGNEHYADCYEQAENGRHYVRGAIHHPEHSVVRLEDVLHEAIQNTALGSWSVQGVD